MTGKLTESENVPVLEEWINLTEAAEILGLSRQYVNKIAEKTFKSLHKLGNSPALVVRRSEIEAIKERRSAPPAEETSE